MKQALLIFLATVAASQALSIFPSGTKPSLKVRFGVKDSFIEMPLTVSEAISKKWSLTPRPANSPLPALALWCHESYLACVLYDDTDYISGFQEAFPVARYTDSKFDWKVRGFTKWTPIETGTEYYTAQIYFVDEEYLAKSKEERISERKAAGSKSILQLDGVWVTGINGELFKISKDYEGIKNSIFTKQACIPGMGRHFYYNMTREAECTSESMFAWFPLVHSGRLVAVGLTTFGKLPENGFDIFERPPTLAVKAIVPRGPQCLYDLADNPGLVTSHIYFDVSSPLTELTCILQ